MSQQVIQSVDTPPSRVRKYVRDISTGGATVSLAIPISILQPSATDESYQGSGAVVGGRAGLTAKVITGVARSTSANFTPDKNVNAHVLSGGWPVTLAAGDSFKWYADGTLSDLKLTGDWRLFVEY